jgi:hypothetical protein
MRKVMISEPVAVLALEAVTDCLVSLRASIDRAKKKDRKPPARAARDLVLYELAQRELAAELVPARPDRSYEVAPDDEPTAYEQGREDF